jgi:ABC-type lipoprotein export system ATPase subunit
MVTHDDVLAKQAQKITYLKDGKVVTKSEIKRM